MATASKRKQPVAKAERGALDDIEDTMRHHRAAWRAERIGWTIMALLLLGALIGAFGDGPLSRARSGSPQSLSLQYDRLLRASAPSQYRFEAHPSTAPGGELRLRFDRALLEDIELESIVPQPEREEAGPDYTEFIFRTAPGPAPLKIDFRYRPTTFGLHGGRVSVGDAHAVTIDQFVYP